jgi:hypothetical protein
MKKNPLSRIFLVVSLLLVAGFLIAGVTARQTGWATNSAKEFAQRMGIEFQSSIATEHPPRHPQQTIWLVSEGPRVYSIHKETKRVTMFADASAIGEAQSIPVGSQTPFSVDVEAWRRADVLRGQIGSSMALQKYRMKFSPPIAGIKSSSTGLVQLQYQAVAFGIETKLVGNSLSISINSRTGRFASMKLTNDWSYIPPSLQISESAAIAKAKAVVLAQYERADVANPSVMKQYIAGSDGYGSVQGPALRIQRKCVYGYAVNFKRHYVLIDGRNGVVLGGGMIK